MSSDQNIRRVLVIGNGFDLAVGRKTSYKDFYESGYCPKIHPAPIIKFLNQKLSTCLDSVRWIDLESSLQEYALRPDDKDVYTKEEKRIAIKYGDSSHPKYSIIDGDEEILNSMIRSNKIAVTRDFFQTVDVPFDIKLFDNTPLQQDKFAFSDIEKGLAQYIEKEGEKHADKNAFIVYTLKHYLDSHDSVYSFNYTRVGSLLTDDIKEAERYDSMIHYMHGSVSDGHVIIGAKDGDYGDYDFVQKSFDPQFNPPPLLREMMDADEVVIYGHSLGDCDSQYFEPFFKHLVESTDDMDKKVIIYTYDDDAVIQIKKNLQKMTGNRLSWLYSMREFDIIKTKKEDKTSE